MHRVSVRRQLSTFLFRMPYSRLASGPKGVDAYILSSSTGNDNSGRAPLSENELARRFKPNRKPNLDPNLQSRTAEMELEYARAVRSCQPRQKNLESLVPEPPTAQPSDQNRGGTEEAEKTNPEPVAADAPRKRKRARVLDQVKESYGGAENPKP